MSSQPLKGRLISQFEHRELPDHGKGWCELWDAGESDLWDRGYPSPALIDLVEEYQELFDPFRASDSGREFPGQGRTRKKALVPGCGRGYDVVALALHGFDTYGLEISPMAISQAKAYTEKEMVSPQPYNFGSKYRGLGTAQINSAGTAHLLQGDFFASDWTQTDSGVLEFDLIYDYTFLCALHPSQRGRWADRMAELLRPGGLLVCLEFPMYKDPTLPGPPWGVNGVHLALLSGEDGGGKFERRVYLRPERTYKVGMGSDMISVYERK